MCVRTAPLGTAVGVCRFANNKYAKLQVEHQPSAFLKQNFELNLHYNRTETLTL